MCPNTYFVLILLCFGYLIHTSLEYDENNRFEIRVMEEILSEELDIAKCQAGCSNSFSPCIISSDCSQCKRVFRLLQESPAWSSICSDGNICKTGCSVACHVSRQPDSVQRLEHVVDHWNIEISGCRLHWSPEILKHRSIKRYPEIPKDKSIMYLVTAKDKQGMFYHVATVSATQIDIPRSILTKAEKIIVLAVGEEGVLEKHQIEVAAEHLECRESKRNMLISKHEIDEEFPILPVIILGILSTLLVMALVILARVLTKFHVGKDKKESPTLCHEEALMKQRRLSQFGIEIVDIGGAGADNCGFSPEVREVYMSRSIII